ncbi:MAG: hydroxymethylglutaryl-CoA synthase family protein [archaeon]|nr:hydroxymethylglutaryl-CoA synthase family protein [archaeon]
MSNIGIIRYGAYLPKYILERKQIAEAWDFPSIPGGIAVGNNDEDTITMAVEAGLDCLGEIDPSSIDGLFFASTTSPYVEKKSASFIANVLDFRSNIIAMDICNSTGAASNAIARAYEAIKAGSAKKILVLGSDMQTPMPESMYEYQYGSGAAAVLIGEGSEVVLTIEGYTSTSDNVIGPWKRANDKFIHQFQTKHEGRYGYASNMIKAFKNLLNMLEIDPKSVKKAALYAPDPRKGSAIGQKIGFTAKSIEGSPFLDFGNTGNAFALMTLILAVRRAKTDSLIAFGNYGDGADAFIFKVVDKTALKNLHRTCRGVTGNQNSMLNISYPSYLSKKKLLETTRFTRKSSPVWAWRDEKFLLRLFGAKCKSCGAVQYPIPRVCIECSTKDQLEDIKLKKIGTIFTFTLDHLQGGNYFDTPVPRCVIDLDGGGRILCDMTDVENPTEEVKIGMKVELTFRWMHPGADFHNYYWKCRPIRIEPKMESKEVEV